MPENINIPLYLFAKAPEPGKVKTRMSPHLSHHDSAWLASMMLQQSLEKICASWPGITVLTVANDAEHIVFENLKKEYNIRITSQVGDNLGSRLAHALKEGIDQTGFAVVMGCDVPHFDSRILPAVYRQLIRGENVVGPAIDGGFYLLGLTDIPPELFRQIQWGGEKVLGQMMLNAEQSGLSVSRCETLRDIDTWEDLVWLSQIEPQYQIFVRRPA